MLKALDGLRELSFQMVVLRMVLAMVCGAVVGFERSYKNRPAGLRTHILVCLAAAIAEIAGTSLYLVSGVPSDPSRIGAQVIAGLGFIGAGTIIVTRRSTVIGLTTAAGLWSTGVVGLAIGSGFYEGGVLLTLLIILVKRGYEIVDARFIPLTSAFQLVIRYEQRESLDQVLGYCKDNRLTITNLRVAADAGTDPALYTAVISLRSDRRVDQEGIVAAIRQMPGIERADAADTARETATGDI